MNTIAKLRPAKVRSAATRRWFERRVPGAVIPSGDVVEDVGTDYGGWLLPVEHMREGWTAYCIGAGGDISFDVQLIRRWNATVRSVDPVEPYIEAAHVQAGHDPRFTAVCAAVTVAEGPIRVQRYHDPRSLTVSGAGLYDGHDYVEVPGRTLAAIMEDFGDTRIDLLKVDTEGTEYELLPTLDLRALGVQVFCVQLHHTGTVRDARALIGEIERRGYRTVGHRPTLKVSFVRTD